MIIIFQSVIDDKYYLLTNIDLKCDDNELLIVEEIVLLISMNRLIQHVNVFLDRDYNEKMNWKFFIEEFFIKRIIKDSTMRLLRQSHSISEELKITYFDR